MSVLYDVRDAIARARAKTGDQPAAHYVSAEDFRTLEEELRRFAYKPGQIKRDGLITDQITIDDVPVKPAVVT